MEKCDCKLRQGLRALISSIASLSVLLANTQHIVPALAYNGFLTYENTFLGIKIQYPSNWERLERGVDTIVSRPDDVIFRSPKQFGNLSNLPVVVEVSSENFSSGLVQYSEVTLKSIKENTRGSDIAGSMTTLAGYPAYEIVDNFRHHGHDLKVTDIWTVINGIVYRITVYADRKTSSYLSSIIQTMVTSFAVTKPNILGP